MGREKVKLLTGNQAVAEALRQAKPDFFLSTLGQRPGSVAEKIHRYANDYLFEGETFSFPPSAAIFSFALGAALSGSRTSLSITSQEISFAPPHLSTAALGRLPLVVNVVRQSDFWFLHNGGCINIHTGSAQEAYEANLLAIRLSEDDEVRLPVVIIRDDYFGSEIFEEVSLLSDSYAARYLGGVKLPAPSFKNADKSIFSARHQTEGRLPFLQSSKRALARSLTKYKQYAQALNSFTGSDLSAVDYFGQPQPSTILITSGSKSGDARQYIEKGATPLPLGLLAVRLRRPFPSSEVKQAIARCGKVGVWESREEAEEGKPLYDEIAQVVGEISPKPKLYLFFGDDPEKFFREMAKI